MTARNRPEDDRLIEYARPHLQGALHDRFVMAPDFAPYDLLGHRYIVEIKGRQISEFDHAADGYYLSKRKRDEMMKIALDIHNVPVFAWAMLDNLRWVDLFTLEAAMNEHRGGDWGWEMRGRYDRGATNDIEWMCRVPRDWTHALPDRQLWRPPFGQRIAA